MTKENLRNPFIVSGPIPEKYFCDRVDESRRLIRDVTNGSNLVLISPRRMGKTGLIEHCFRNPLIAEHYDTFYVDILQTSSLKEFTYLLGREIFNRLAPLGRVKLKQFMALLRSISGSFGFDTASGLPTFNLQLGDIATPEITLEEIFSYLAKSEVPTIVAIDEFQQIATYENDKNIEALLRSHIQKLPNTNFIFAGSERHMLHQMFTDSARPFYNSASVLELHAIKPDVYFDFASRLFESRGKQLERDATEVVYRLFDGNTFYLQKTFNLAFAMTRTDGKCTVDTVTYAICDTLGTYDTIYRETLSRINEPQKQLLLAIAQEGEAAKITSAKFIRNYSLTSASSVQSAAKKLLEHGFITQIDRVYRVQDPLMSLWLRIHYGTQTLQQLIINS